MTNARLPELPYDGNGQKFDIKAAGDVELLLLAVRYLEGVRAHERLIGAVRRAALRLLDTSKER